MSNLIQIIAAIGTLAVAVATFRTVREMRAQREDALRVEFTLSIADAAAYREDEAGDYGAYDWKNLAHGDTFLGIECANVGAAAAKKVKVQWLLKWDSVLAELNRKLACDDDPEDNVELRVQGDTAVSVLIRGSEDQRWLPRPDVQCFPSILPYATSRESTYVDVPFRIRRLCDLAYDAWIRDGLGSRELLRAVLRFDYQNLNSTQYSQTFDVQFRSFDLDVETDLEAYGVVVGEYAVLEVYGVD